jgi:hypothetical protein
MAVTWKYDAPTGTVTTVEVTFTETDPAITHVRSVNAVFTDSKYDADLTETRVGEVALGVNNKIAVGAITAPDASADDSSAE